MKKSEPMSLNTQDVRNVWKDTLYFALVPMTFYITAILGVIQLPNHIISLNDFIPSNTTIISIVSWLLSQALNLIRKYVN